MCWYDHLPFDQYMLLYGLKNCSFGRYKWYIVNILRVAQNNPLIKVRHIVNCNNSWILSSHCVISDSSIFVPISPFKSDMHLSVSCVLNILEQILVVGWISIWWQSAISLTIQLGLLAALLRRPGSEAQLIPSLIPLISLPMQSFQAYDPFVFSL